MVRVVSMLLMMVVVVFSMRLLCVRYYSVVMV